MVFLFKILNYIKSKGRFTNPIYGRLYKLKGESMPFRYVNRRGDKEKGIHRFKHHNLKQYIFYNFHNVEREADKEEVRIYNIIKPHVDNIAKNI